MFVEDGSLSDIVLQSVEWQNVAGCSHPKRHNLRFDATEVGYFHHCLMRQLIGTSMSTVVHYQRSVCHILCYEVSRLWESISSGRFLQFVCIPHNLLNIESRLRSCNHFRYIVGINHVSVIVTVVTHHHNGVLPYPGVWILAVFNYLIHHQLCLDIISHWQSPYSHIGFSRTVIVVSIHLNFLSVVEHTIEVVRHETGHIIERVLALEAQQEVVGTLLAPSWRKHSVVPCPVTKKQQILGSLICCSSTIV